MIVEFVIGAAMMVVTIAAFFVTLSGVKLIRDVIVDHDWLSLFFGILLMLAAVYIDFAIWHTWIQILAGN